MSTATSNQSPITIGGTKTTIESVVKDAGKDANGNRLFTTEVQRVNGTQRTPIANIDSKGKVTPTKNATTAEATEFGNPNSQLRQGVSQQIRDPKVQNTLGVSTEQDKKTLAGASGSGAATNSETGQGTDGQGGNTNKASQADFDKENQFKEGTRTSYEKDLRYPLDLSIGQQDVIRFSILEYSPSLAKENQTTSGGFGSGKSRVVILEGENPIVKGSKRIGGITLPIPAGISDSNTCSWNNDELTMVGMELSNFVQGFFNAGGGGAEQSAGNTLEKLEGAASSGDLQKEIQSYFGSMAVQGANIRGRGFGAAANNNIELLFTGPSLRSFNFTFMFYPREPDEAIMVRKIIRAFKQAMSVKRSQTSLLLKSPHTFAIQYMTAGQQAHPYLNKFKECALTSCSVDYTPDNTYMTYGGNEKSMTSYRLSLQFQELEPIFDDEYGDPGDKFIGF